VPETQITK